MYTKALSVLFIVVMLSVPAAYAGQEYLVTLTNGNTLTANSYRLEGRKVYLRYPVGEVALPASEVAAVSVGDGSVELLQINGELKPPAASGPAEAAQPNQAGASLAKTSAGQPKQAETGIPSGSPKALTEKQDERTAAISTAIEGASPAKGTVTGSLGGPDADYDPVADSLAEQLLTADDKQAEAITRKLNEHLENSGNAQDSKQQ